ncbi:MAG: DNA adenine methylase [Alphaproteobacteria bacterium]|nr:DNA adenine methylase [Alphaproteobacteria bacterium]
MRYGLGYCGSKNGIAEWVCDYIPNSRNFYDLFAGGCAITHCSMLRKKSENYLINDISDVVELFYDAVMGKYKNETRWISREDFYNLKDNDPYIRYCWSFGNRGFEYMYSREVEPWKKALHYARVFGDFSEFAKFGINITNADRVTVARNQDEWKQKYIIWYCKEILHSSLDVLELQKNLTERIERNSEELRNYLLTGLKIVGKRPCDVDKYLGTNGMAGHYFGKSQWEFPTYEVYVKLQSFLDLPLEYEKIYGLQDLLQSLQRLQSLERLQSLQRLERLTLSVGSYKIVKIEPDSVIYCDIPYRGTAEYIGGFNHDEFYSWCEQQTELVIISEYDMPRDRFVCIAEKEKPVLLASGTSGKAIERLFIPKHQIDLYDSKKMDIEQLTLF